MPTPDPYLEATEIIDWDHPEVSALARALAEGHDDPSAVARACFEWVRDEVAHSWEHQRDVVTLKASEVLSARTGFCYAKSHLLAALLRANGLPTGLCYQRLSVDDQGAPFCLHGLNAVRLPGQGWYRLDPRGNNATIDAQFTPPLERLAFPIRLDGEADLPEIWAEPLPVVVRCLSAAQSIREVYERLPDLPLISPPAPPL